MLAADIEYRYQSATLVIQGTVYLSEFKLVSLYEWSCGPAQRVACPRRNGSTLTTNGRR